jgi:hypothetical protein
MKQIAKRAEVVHTLSAHYGEEPLSHNSVYDLCTKFSESREEVINWPHAYFQLATVTDVKAHAVEELILENSTWHSIHNVH